MMSKDPMTTPMMKMTLNKPSWLVFLLSIVVITVFSCQNEPTRDKVLSTDELYQQALISSDEQQRLNLISMKATVAQFQLEINKVRQELEATQTTARTQSAIYLDSGLYEGIHVLMSQLKTTMKPLSAGVDMEFRPEMLPDTNPAFAFGSPPLANEKFLQQLWDDVAGTERAILEAIN